jgi:RNA 2',3'-cyclic 3'-phosphodiesterase
MTDDSGMTVGEARHRRLFVALDPDEAVRAGVAAAIASLRLAAGPAGRQLRFGDPATVHLTLRFLGDVAEARVESVAAAVAAAAAESRPLSLEVRGAGAFPSPRRARVAWLGLGGDLAPLAALAAGLDRHLAPLGFAAESRPFTPHLTVARARAPGGAHGLAASLEAASAALAPVPWRAEALTLFESHLERAGARHLPLLRAPLGAPSSPGVA